MEICKIYENSLLYLLLVCNKFSISRELKLYAFKCKSRILIKQKLSSKRNIPREICLFKYFEEHTMAKITSQSIIEQCSSLS